MSASMSSAFRGRASLSKTGLFLCAAAFGALYVAQKASAQQQPFPMEASISDLRQALGSGRLSSSGLVDFYLKRIEAYDRAGPDLNSLITVNPNAAAEAKRLDEESKPFDNRKTALVGSGGVRTSRQNAKVLLDVVPGLNPLAPRRAA